MITLIMSGQLLVISVDIRLFPSLNRTCIFICTNMKVEWGLGSWKERHEPPTLFGWCWAAEMRLSSHQAAEVETAVELTLAVLSFYGVCSFAM